MVMGTGLGTDRAANAKGTPTDASSEIRCTLLVSEKQGLVDQRLTVQFSITNRSDRTLILPLPKNTRLLLAWGILSASIRDSKGTLYQYVPDPGPFIPPQRDHYVSLKPNEKVVRDLNLCWFRDNTYSDSPCSRSDRYTVSVSYSNEKASYWDNNLGDFVRIDGVWKGKTACGLVTVEIAQSVTLEKIFSKLSSIGTMSYQSRIRAPVSMWSKIWIRGDRVYLNMGGIKMKQIGHHQYRRCFF
jgi:hypothetical protein